MYKNYKTKTIFVILHTCLNKNKTCFYLIFLKYYLKLYDLIILITHPGTKLEQFRLNFNFEDYSWVRLSEDVKPL